ncbi:MAG: PadR family transcriptional regulator [Pelagibacterales bacterium]|nr:PadR family transcriptional regulator [Pelagibacterales bacterium]
MQTDTICLGILRSGPATGYVIKSVLEGPLNQIYNLSFGSIYPALSKLTKEKYVTVKQHAQDKKPDKKVYTITKKGISYFEETLLEESGKYVRSGNYSDQIKSEFAMLLLFSKSLPKQNIKLILDERILSAQQQLNLITYEGPIAKDSNLNALRNSAQGQFTRGLMAEVIKTAINYIEKNRKKLHD